MTLEQLDDAERDLLHAIDLAKRRDPTAFNSLGVLRLTQGKPEEALEAFAQSLQLRPQAADKLLSIYRTAQLHLNLGTLGT